MSGAQPWIKELAELSGLKVSEGNLAKLEVHVQSRVKQLKLAGPAEFLRHFDPHHPLRAQESGLLAEALTTRETFFMRDEGQMRLLRDVLLPQLIDRKRHANDLQLRLWSCACSTGEEAYSLAILLRELLPDIRDWRITLIGTDISLAALERARAGVYGAWSFRGCAIDFQERHFSKNDQVWRISPALHEIAEFERCDLIHDELPSPIKGLERMDLILCRHLFIYLDLKAVASITRKLAGCLAEGGVLLTGHGELHGQGAHPQGLRSEAHPDSVIYRKVPSSRKTAATVETGAAIKQHLPKARPTVTVQAKKPPSPPPSAVMADRLAQAWKLANEGRLSEARELCQMLEQRNPMEAELHFLASVIATEMGELAEARTALRKALYLNPDLHEANLHLNHLRSSPHRFRR